jgi:hypothetical protein
MKTKNFSPEKLRAIRKSVGIQQTRLRAEDRTLLDGALHMGNRTPPTID